MGKNNDFSEIFQEIRRQFNLIIKIDNSHDTKIGIFLGFIVIAVGQVILLKDISKNFLQTNFSIAFFILATMAIIYSGYTGIRAYFLRRYKLGPNVNALIESYKKGGMIDYSKVVGRRIYEANLWNSGITEEKVIYMKMMILSFIIGFLFLLISKLSSLIKLEVLVNAG